MIFWFLSPKYFLKCKNTVLHSLQPLTNFSASLNTKEITERARVKNNLPFCANLGNTVYFWFSRQAVMLNLWKLLLLFLFLPIQNANGIQYSSSSFVTLSAVISWYHKVRTIRFFLGKKKKVVMANYPDMLKCL